MSTYRIVPLPLVKIEVDKGIFTYRMNYGEKIWVPIYMWYLEGGEKKVLIDSGVDAEFVRDHRGFPTETIQSFDDALISVGLRADDIDLVIQTHLHYDHCGHTARCCNAKAVVQKEELKFAFSPHPVMANIYMKKLFNDLKFIVLDGDEEILPGIQVILSPGHTPGIQAVCVDTKKGKAVISGHCTILENFDPPDTVRELWPVLAPGTHINSLEAFESMLKLKGLADIIIAQHDPIFMKSKRIPED